MSLYRPPNSNNKTFLEEYKKLIDSINKESGKHCIIGMDHNFDFLKNHKHPRMKEFIDMNIDSKLWPVITKPTRVTNSSATLIDNLLVSFSIYYSYQSGILIDDLSDHLPCILCAKNLKLRRKDPIVIRSRKVTPKTISQIKLKLDSIDLLDIVQKGSVNEAFNNFHENLVSVVDEFAPYESFTPGNYSYRKEPWLPVSLLKNIKKQKKLYKKSLSPSASKDDREKVQAL